MGLRYTTAAYRELGEMLRHVREEAGLSSEKLARELGWTLTKISRMENGRRLSTTTDVVQYAVMCGKYLHEIQPLLEFTRLAERRQGYYLSDERIGGSLQSLIFHESSAEHSIINEPHVINGLLQTPEYVAAHITSINAHVTDEILKGAVRTRMERRRILSQPKPARFTFYIHEHALRLPVGTDKIKHEQLLHIVLTAALDNVTVRVVPGATDALSEPFRLMEFHEHRPIVYLDNLRFGGLILEDLAYVRSYQEIVPMLADVALSAGQSRQFAADLADAYDRGSQRGGADGMAQEQLQQRRGNRLRGGGVAEEQLQQRRGNELCGGGVVDPTPIYE